MLNEETSLESFAIGDGGEWPVVASMGRADVRLHGAVVPGAARGEQVQLSGSTRRVRSGSRRRPDPAGRVTALRPAVPAITGPQPLDLILELPEVSRPAGGFPLATVATAGITATIASLFFSPIFALLAGVSAIAVIGRWLGSLIAHRRSKRGRSVAKGNAIDAWSTAADEWGEAEVAARHAGTLTPSALLSMTSGDASPWWKRLETGDRLSMASGLGPLDVEVPMSEASGFGEILSSAERCVVLPSAPVVVALDPGVAVCGDRAEVVAAARWLVASALAEVGPADLSVVLVTTKDRVADWDQLKWAPSIAACVVVDEDRDDALLDALERAKIGGAADARQVLVVVDGAEPTGSGLLARVLSGRVEHVMLLWLGGVEGIPAGCRSSVTVAADGRGLVRDLDRPGEQTIDWFALAEEQWGQVMRWLARFDDPECVADGQGLASSLALADVVASATDGPGRFASSIERRWAAATTQRLSAPIGLDGEGTVEIDLVADGPHMLAAGTTGAGKSELLRTLVVGLASEQPPEVVSFVLIDFKGGGAFDLVAPLPHVAAVVTDLDPAEAGRALRGLRAEILDREHRLRDMEISDVGDIDRLHPRAFGRMVVIVDEFAALADELPEFLDGLVDIARRGRSLGVHLVLATQRPSGVVTGQIRANTNLRLCLRVQDRGDSIDVIDDPVAGRLPAIPGRAVLRRGGSRCQQLQVAQVSGVRDATTAEPFRLHPTVSASEEAQCVVDVISASLDRAGRGEPDGMSLVDRIVAAAGDVSRAVAPWVTTPLKATFPVDGPGSAIGLLDDPDRRTVSAFSWNLDADGLLVVGADETQIAATAATAVAAALDVDPSLPTFVLDGDRGGSTPLEMMRELPPVVDLIGVGEPERLLRAVEQLERTNEPRLVVVHNWIAVADALNEVAGPLGAERLAKLVRRAGTPGVGLVVTARSDRDVPQRVLGSLGCRVLHRLADPAGFLSFGLRPADVGALGGAGFVDPASALIGQIAAIDAEALASLRLRLAGAGVDGNAWPSAIRVLGSRVHRAEMPSVETLAEGWRVPIGLDVEMAPQWIVVAPRRPVVVLAHPGGGRTTALDTISAALGGSVCVIDDADSLDNAALTEQLGRAESEGQAVVVGCTPSHAKRFGTATAELLSRSTVVLVNPSRNEGDLVRLSLPDLTGEPVGRAVLVDRGRATVLQIAA